MTESTNSPFDVAISIINYRTAELTIACVETVVADLASSDLRGDVVVVDNASGDGSADVIDAWIAAHPDTGVRQVRSEVNTGFSGGHNIGITASDAPFVLVLNSDAELRLGCLRFLLDAADANPKAGLIAPRLEDEDGTVQTSSFRFHSPWSEVIRGACTGIVTKALSRWDVPLGPDPDPGLIEWASFACILLRREMIDAIGPMDEGYFLYFEDVEYTRRARLAGWGVARQAQARCIHHRGGSGPVKSLEAARKRMPAYYYASRTRFFHQRGGWLGLYAANLGWFAGRAIAQLRRLTGKPAARAVQGEARDIWINALQPLGPRRAPGE